MPTNTYVALATTTLGTASSAVTLSSIPAGYTDLVMVINLANTSNTGLWVTLNTDGGSTTKYSGTRLWGNGSAVGTDRQTNYSSFILTVGDGKETIVHFQNYSNTTTNKTMLSRHSSPYSDVGANVGLWRDTSAINSITVNSGPAMAIGTTINIYGVAAASVGAKATGGAIYSDSSYYYHVFSGNGTFTPTQSISADILAIAGGGSGGGQYAGGGGAGGVVYDGSRSLTTTGYTVTVGGGGASITGSANGNTGTNTSFDTLVANGGGGGGSWNGTGANGLTGGSGGGGSMGTSTGNTTSGGAANQGTSTGDVGYGFNGGGGLRSAGGFFGGGGGGAGAIGGTVAGIVAGSGGAGINTYSSWLTATGFGVDGFIAGGGGGGAEGAGATNGAGGAGGGGAGGLASVSAIGIAGRANTGSGGGGYAANATGASGAGGSGVVIVRYAK